MEIGAFILGSDSSDSHTPSYVHMPDFFTPLYTHLQKSRTAIVFGICVHKS